MKYREKGGEQFVSRKWRRRVTTTGYLCGHTWWTCSRVVTPGAQRGAFHLVPRFQPDEFSFLGSALGRTPGSGVSTHREGRLL